MEAADSAHLRVEIGRESRVSNSRSTVRDCFDMDIRRKIQLHKQRIQLRYSSS